jgi:hypothetical protein
MSKSEIFHLSFLIIPFLVLLHLPHQTWSLVKCKKEILNNFYLTGLEHSIYEPMYVCPGVHDKCCSIGDEIKMKHMYDKHTAPILERRVAFVMRSIGSTMESFMEMIDIDVNMMVLSYSVPRSVFYKEMKCESTPRVLPTKNEDKRFNRYFSRLGIPKPKKKKKKSKKKPKNTKPKGRKLKEQVRKLIF